MDIMNFYYNCCNKLWVNKCEYLNHLILEKHDLNSDKFVPKQNEYFCEVCNLSTRNKCEIIKHFQTKKHMKNLNIFKGNMSLYQCDKCNKIYKNYKSCWAHSKKCDSTLFIEKTPKNVSDVSTQHQPDPLPEVLEKENDIKDIESNKDLYILIINKLFSENQELRNFVVEQSKEHSKDTKELVSKVLEISSTKNTIVTNTLNGNINNTNKFNINLFLNDKCKDALNLSEFIDNMEIKNEDLENNASLGFVGGISKILLDNLKNLSIYERPIHCTDVKRETIYIKDEDKWEKEEDMKKMKMVIQEISRKSLMQLCKWREENPEYNDLDSELGMKCIMMNQASIAGANRDQYYGKVIKTLIKETFIDKTNIF